MTSTILHSHGKQWFDWIIENTERGCTATSMLEKMRPSWTHTDAQAALIAAKNILENPSINRPLIDLSRNFIQCGDRTGQILFTLNNPHIVLIDNVLSGQECDEFVSMARQKGLTKSCVVDPDSGDSVDHNARSSSGTFFTRSENPLVATIENRLSTLNNWPTSQAEGLQILQYEHGQEYRPHFDWFDPNKKGSTKHLARGGQRVGTFVLYLTDVEAGGSTAFPNLGVQVFPKKGAVVYFSNIDETGQPCPQTHHGGSPVISGTKIIATYWQRERAY